MPKREPPERPWSPQRQWMEWELDVMAPGSKVAPLEVEQATAGNGWPMRSWHVGPEDRIALDAGRWPWSTACAWISALTRPEAEEAVAAFRKWRGREWRNGIGRALEGRTLALAEVELRGALASGAVKARAFRGARPVLIPAAEWPGLEWQRDEHGEALEFDELLLFGEPRYRAVTLSRAEVMKWWPARDGWAPHEVEMPDPPGPVEDAPEVGTVEDPPAAVQAPIDVEFRPAAEAAALAGPATEAGVVRPSADTSQGAEARAARSSHAQRRVAYLREKVPDPSKPGVLAALRRHSDEYQKLHGRKPVGDTQHGNDLKALRTPQK